MRQTHQKIKSYVVDWLVKDRPIEDQPMCDFERIRYELKPGDVILTEGTSRISEFIKHLTKSSWSHAALYIGRIHDIEDVKLRRIAQRYYPGPPENQLIIESILGKGTIISPISNYMYDNIRICRPKGLSPSDARNVLTFAINELGKEYDLRLIIDLMRYFLPVSVLPRKMLSTIFTKNPNDFNKTICSSMIAEAFISVDFPVLPVIKKQDDKGIEMIQMNPKLFTPRDFDYSPYFEIIKFPFVDVEQSTHYKKLPWKKDDASHLSMKDNETKSEYNSSMSKVKKMMTKLNPFTKKVQTSSDSNRSES